MTRMVSRDPQGSAVPCIANAVLRPRIEAVCRSAGCEPPVICTPQEFLEKGELDA